MLIRNNKIILALYAQLQNYAGLDYVKSHGYHSRDAWELVTLKNYPFYTVIPNDPSKRIERVDEISKLEMERHVYRIVIQYATWSIRFDNAIMGDDATNTVGILDLQDDIWDAIISDRKIGGAVRGLLPTTEEVSFDMVGDKETEGFLAGGQIELEYYNDMPIE